MEAQGRETTMLNVAAVAELLEVSVAHVHELLTRGAFPCRDAGDEVQILDTDVRAYMAERDIRRRACLLEMSLLSAGDGYL